jgi:pimeloyl-ACP methyl ester carboxylesterase
VNPAQRAGVAGATLVAAAVGAAAGFAAERVVAGRSTRRDVEQGPHGLGQLRGPHSIVEANDGVQLYVEVDEARPDARWGDLTVLFVHGYALNLDSYHYQRLALRGNARLAFFDQRSHGRSGRGDSENSTLRQLSDDLRRVLDAVAPNGPVVLVGHSMGGMTVMELARLSPELFGTRVVGVALMSTSTGELADVTLGLPAFAARAVKRVTPRLVSLGQRTPGIFERGRRMSSDLSLLVTKTYAFASPVPDELVDFALAMINGTPIEVLAEFYPALQEHDALDALPVFEKVECLLLVGEQDLLTPADHTRAMLRVVPGAELVVLDPGGHLVLLERPDDVNAHLIDLVERASRTDSP